MPLLPWSTYYIQGCQQLLYSVGDLRNGFVDDIHVSRFKFYLEGSLDTKVVLSHVFQSKARKVVHRLMILVESDDDLMVQVQWREFFASKDTYEVFGRIYKDVPQLLL